MHRLIVVAGANATRNGKAQIKTELRFVEMELCRDMFDAREYEQKCIIKQLDLMSKMIEDPNYMDMDAFNLTMMMLDIRPYSKAWRCGHVRSLKRAIKMLEK